MATRPETEELLEWIGRGGGGEEPCNALAFIHMHGEAIFLVTDLLM